MLFNPLRKPNEPDPDGDRNARRIGLSWALTAIGATSVAAVGLALGSAIAPGAGSGGGGEETRTLTQLCADAKAGGGRLVVYAGGDWKDQQDDTKRAFEQRYPDATSHTAPEGHEPETGSTRKVRASVRLATGAQSSRPVPRSGALMSPVPGVPSASP